MGHATHTHDGGGGGDDRRWRVLKFGGTSVAGARGWHTIERVVRARQEAGYSVVVVCSAVAGVTNLLAELVSEPGGRAAVIDRIVARHDELAESLGLDSRDAIHREIGELRALVDAGRLSAAQEAVVLSRGELMSTRIGAAWLRTRGMACGWVDARDLLESEPGPSERDERYLSASCSSAPSADTRERLAREACDVIVTQGFVARSPEGETVVLGRGGSDTSAAYLAGKLTAERLEVWTDVPGLFTANPHQIGSARLLVQVGYREAQALGALGAKVLHPRAIEPAIEHGIPIEIGWTHRPDVGGTRINAARASRGVQAITSRGGLALLSLRRPPSWQPIGFMADVAACFKRRGLSMDLVSSSCSEIRVTVDLRAFPSAQHELEEIVGELARCCVPRLIPEVASVSLVGAGVGRTLLGQEEIYNLFAHQGVYMVVHAADESHVSFVVDEAAARQLVPTIHAQLFEPAQLELNSGPTWSELVASDRPMDRSGHPEGAV